MDALHYHRSCFLRASLELSNAALSTDLMLLEFMRWTDYECFNGLWFWGASLEPFRASLEVLGVHSLNIQGMDALQHP